MILTSWMDVKAVISARFNVNRMGDDWLLLIWALDRDLDRRGAVQPQIVREVRQLHRTYVDIICALRVRSFSPGALLEKSATLAVGQVILVGGRPCLRHRLELDGLSLDRLEEAMAVIAGEAAGLQICELDDAAFLHYAG